MPRRNEYAFTLENFRQAIRRGPYCYGMYERYFITSDGAALCYTCAEKERTSVLWSIANECSDGWRIVAERSSDELENAERCDHCNEYIQDYWKELHSYALPSHWIIAFEYGEGEGFPSSDTDENERADLEAFRAFTARNVGTYETTTDRDGFFTTHNALGTYAGNCSVFWFRPATH